jgi:hypothetical protein
MARKTNKAILTEGEMRRFMKLANISPLEEMGYGDEPGARDEEEEKMDEQEEMGAEEEEVEAAEMEAPVEMDDEPAMDEPEMDMDIDMGAEEGGEKMVDVEQFLSILDSALTDAVEEVTGQEVEVSADMDDMEGGLEAPEEGGDQLDMEMPPMGDEEEGEEEMDMDMMAERIARRVKARMMQESRKQKALDQRADELTDKIFARLMKESR